jgi:hypothetical protein
MSAADIPRERCINEGQCPPFARSHSARCVRANTPEADLAEAWQRGYDEGVEDGGHGQPIGGRLNPYTGEPA